MHRPLRCLFTFAFLLVQGVALAADNKDTKKPELVEVTKIWDKAQHSAFTDLIRWRGKFYCTFREGMGHVKGDGKLRVLESIDGKDWQPIALLEEEGIDLRDPHISITPDDRLMIVAGGSVYKGGSKLLGYQPRVAFSKDGRKWTPTERVLAEGEWLWRVTWHDGKAYGVSYDEKDIRLVGSDDGVQWKLIAKLDVERSPNETTLRFLPNGDMIAMVRRDGSNPKGVIGTSKPPYTAWKWKEAKHRFGGPNFILLPDGSMWASSRNYVGKITTTVGRMTLDSYEPSVTLPSGGDTSYAGLVWHDGLLWVSYYSSHEGKSNIYLAKIKLPESPVNVESRLELFVDDVLISRLGGSAKQVLQQPRPGDVVLTADKPWEGNTSAYFTVFQDGDLYRMYYRGSHWDEKARKETHREVTCYAESKDGVNWTKPNLGLFEFNGSKENNIVWDDTDGTHNFAAFKDKNPKAPPESRYKALAGHPGLKALQSPDGIHWSLMSKDRVIKYGAFDSQNLAFFDPLLGKYRDFHRHFRVVRDIMTCTSDDFVNWTRPTFLTYSNAPLEHLYTNAILQYERAPHLLLGFPTRFLPKGQHVEPTFMSSRDGQSFYRWTDPVIPRTAPKDRDGNRSNYMAWGLVKLAGRDKELGVYGTEAYYAGPGSRLRLFTYRVDGFVSIHAGAEEGELLTKPLLFKGDKLELNYVTAPTGSLRVELQDAEGKAVAETEEMKGDAIDQPVTWKTGRTLRTLAGQPVRLRFVMKDADVYSFRFR